MAKISKINRSFKLRRGKLNFSEQFFPARPGNLWKSTRTLASKPVALPKKIGLPIASNAAYTRWLRNESMLAGASQLANRYAGSGSMWQNPFAKPRPRMAASIASVWYTAYPASIITKKGQSILASLADGELWDVFQDIGIQGLHTGPVKLAGGVSGWKLTPSIDGHFDRISNKLDPAFGTEAEFQKMTQAAGQHNGIVIDDIVPGHTGKGADFRLAEMKYRDYPGIYHMVEIADEDEHLLPEVPAGQDAVNINHETEEELKKRGYIIGRLQRVIFYEPGVKETNWSATKPVRGVDGKVRRWVYLHYFKAGQPSINWLDPTFAGMKLVIGDALHSIGELGTRGLRLDANGFLGIEKASDDAPAWSEGHPLSEAANLVIAGMVRKLGGFTFQELNLSFDDIKTMAGSGADLSYDFVNRPAYHHALVTADTEFLRLTLRTAREYDIDPASLVHALQNHDDLTCELVHFWTIHKNDLFTFRNTEMTGTKLRDTVRHELQKVVTDSVDYNLPFTTNGISCTTASVIAATLGYKDVTKLSAEQVETIKQAHLLLAMFNALQPGVFALSGWDMIGALPLARDQVQELTVDGDTRWINRGGYDLLNSNPTTKTSAAGMPRATSLYGSLTDQLQDANSFASRLKQMLNVREQYGLAKARQLDIPEVSQPSILVMVHRLSRGDLQITVLNFANKTIEGSVSSDEFPACSAVLDMFANENVVATVDNLHAFQLKLEPYQGRSLLIKQTS